MIKNIFYLIIEGKMVATIPNSKKVKYESSSSQLINKNC